MKAVLLPAAICLPLVAGCATDAENLQKIEPQAMQLNQGSRNLKVTAAAPNIDYIIHIMRN
jgi:hypothetical protein